MIYTLTLNPALDHELTVPDFIYDEVLRATHSRTDPGGKGFNVSRALKALGANSVALGFIGGPAGEQLIRSLEALSIRTDFIWIEGETRTNLSIVNAARERYLKINLPGPEVRAIEQAALLEEVRRLAAPGDWWVISGSLPPGMDPDYYAAIIDAVQSAGARAAFDSSGDALCLGCIKKPSLLKPNQAEAQELSGLPADSLAGAGAAIRHIHTLGIEVVALSLGAQGALLSTGEACWLAQPPRIIERNPIGAGDALLAGLVWALDQGHAPDEALTWGVACGAAAASIEGTGVGTAEYVAALVPEVRLSVFDVG